MSGAYKNIPALIVAGTGSGVGKTSIALGLARALRERGLRVQPFKVGPDYLDPTWLTAAAGRTCYNLDGWMTDREYVTASVFEKQCRDADIAIIEGVMGLFDGASPDALTGSTAEIALWLDAPVLLTVDVGGAARSAAAMVKGFADFEAGVRLAGVIANQCGSAGHAEIVARALQHAGLPALIGWLAKKSLPTLPGRHLGLHAAHDRANSAELLTELGRICAEQMDMAGLLNIAGFDDRRRAEATEATEATEGPEATEAHSASGRDAGDNASTEAAPTFETTAANQRDGVRIAVARDAAFYFYYADNLSLLVDAGAELIEFSPLGDRELPAGVDAVYIGGGYPEEHAQELAANAGMIGDLRRFAAQGGMIYGECGGLMYLSKSLQTVGGEDFEMLGLLPFASRMLEKRKMLGYVETTFVVDTCFGPADTRLRGHEFHYSELVPDEQAEAGVERVFVLRGRRNQAPRPEGFRNPAGNVLASYAHQHFGSHPEAARNFVRALRERRHEISSRGPVASEAQL
ncbi:MAG: cobyrinate a,c-diamide synthase [bacterium]|nr:cobyrinate a,c-diamide synthase [bacterium]